MQLATFENVWSDRQLIEFVEKTVIPISSWAHISNC